VNPIERDAALLDETHPLARRELVIGAGTDRVRFLHGIVTANVAGTPVGQGRRAALLTPKGHVVADLRTFVREDAIWIIVDAGQAKSVAGALARYAIMDDFTAAARPGWKLLPVLGPNAGARLAAAGLDVETGALADAAPYTHTEAHFAGEPVWAVRMIELGAPGLWIGGDAATIDRLRAALVTAGVSVLPAAAVEAARIRALEPLFGAEITADYFPMEVGLADAIDYRKGCFLGQEPIVRIRDRGHTNWRLVQLDLAGEGAAAVAPHDVLESEPKPKAGRVTSVAPVEGDGGAVALGMLHLSIPVGATVRVRHGDAVVPAHVSAETARAASDA
jgi:folate-binding protein YgfZ